MNQEIKDKLEAFFKSLKEDGLYYAAAVGDSEETATMINGGGDNIVAAYINLGGHINKSIFEAEKEND